MGILIALALVAVLLRLPPWLIRLARHRGRPDAAEPPRPTDVGGAVGGPEPSALLDESAVRRRLDALTEELDRLDHDPAVFARGFRTTVALSAYQALQAEAAALRARPSAPTAPTLEYEITGSSSGSYEELEL